MSRRGVLVIYNLLLPLGLVLALPGHLVKMWRRGNYSRHFLQRLGGYRPGVEECLGRGREGGGAIWVHAVSVGEVFIARKLIEEMLSQREGTNVVLSTTTSTGYALAERLFGGRDQVTVIYNPVDLPWAVGRAFRKIGPRALILVEAEMWPNLVSKAKSEGIPVMLVNARLSHRSEARFRRFPGMVRPVFGMLDAVLVQFEEDVARWMGLGVAGDRIHLMGSIKFDIESVGDPEQVAVFRKLLGEVAGGGRRRILLAGSTHAGEERLIAGVFGALRAEFPDLFYVVVPRHFERGRGVVEELRGEGFSPVLRSSFGEAAGTGKGGVAGGEEAESGGRCLVVDSTGELASWYCLADMVVIGKSFLAEGGQNPVEPIGAGVPVFFGPRMENFESIVRELKGRGGAVQVEDAAELGERLGEYLREPGKGEAMVAAAQEVLRHHRGSTRRTVGFLLERMGEARIG